MALAVSEVAFEVRVKMDLKLMGVLLVCPRKIGSVLHREKGSVPKSRSPILQFCIRPQVLGIKDQVF
jgi:hypothetical protein